MRTHTKEFQEKLTPEQAYEILVEGNKRFVSNLKMNRNLLQQVNDTANDQYPFTIVLSCMDSRTSTELIFDQGLGEIFSVRIAGNIVNDDILGSMEYACRVVGTKLVVVLGHTRCGAIKGACEDVQMGNLTGLLEKIKPAIEKSNPSYDDCSKPEIYEKVAASNVFHSMEEILQRSSIIRDLFNEGRIGIIGGIYSVETGQVKFVREMFNEKVSRLRVSVTEI
jgi:carbonic anhydrase